jgi:hypothetical protein
VLRARERSRSSASTASRSAKLEHLIIEAKQNDTKASARTHAILVRNGDGCDGAGLERGTGGQHAVLDVVRVQVHAVDDDGVLEATCVKHSIQLTLQVIASLLWCVAHL